MFNITCILNIAVIFSGTLLFLEYNKIKSYSTIVSFAVKTVIALKTDFLDDPVYALINVVYLLFTKVFVAIAAIILFLVFFHFTFFRKYIQREVFLFLFLKFFLISAFFWYHILYLGLYSFKYDNFITFLVIEILFFALIAPTVYKQIFIIEKKRQTYIQNIKDDFYKDQSLSAVKTRAIAKIKEKLLYLKSMSFKEFFIRIILLKFILHINDICIFFTGTMLQIFLITRYVPSFRINITGDNQKPTTEDLVLSAKEIFILDEMILTVGAVLIVLVMISILLVNKRESDKKENKKNLQQEESL